MMQSRTSVNQDFKIVLLFVKRPHEGLLQELKGHGKMVRADPSPSPFPQTSVRSHAARAKEHTLLVQLWVHLKGKPQRYYPRRMAQCNPL